MSRMIATYTFLPRLRQGIANKIVTGDLDTSVKLRAAIGVDLTLTGEGGDAGALTEHISKNVELYGPGDIVGIDSKAIVKCEPKDWITNFEPNYLPFVEFYDEDFPWRYTPAAPDVIKDRLRPWIALVVLKEEDFKDAVNIAGKPLTYITVEDAATKFPPAEQLWAWAHVHANEGLMDRIAAEPGDQATVIEKFQTMLAKNPDLASSRILCPIKLEENAAYHAFLIPTFEVGRLAGLGLNLDPAALTENVHATLSAWADYPGKEEAQNFPFYHRWYFHTGNVGDFEYLVRLLQPKPVDSRVGRRDMDVQEPGSNLRGITDPELGGILKLGGALQIPFDTLGAADQAEVTKYNEWDKPYPHAFQKDLAEFINLTDAYTEKTSVQANSETDLDPAIKDDCDPLITAPLYGRWHALTERLLKKRDGTDISPNNNWVHQLNLDPRWRVAAGYGTGVVQTNQENYMSAAWSQVGEILEANRKMRFAQLAKITSGSWYVNQIGPLIKTSPDKALLFTAPVQKRVLAQGFTMFHHVDKSVISKSVTSIPMRKLIRPGGSVMKRMTFTGDVTADNLISRINEGSVVIAPPKEISPVLPTPGQIAEDMQANVPPFVNDLLRRGPWVKWLILIIAFILLLLLFLFAGFGAAVVVLGTIIAGSAAALFAASLRWEREIKIADAAAEAVKEENQTPASVDDLPKSPDFVLSTPGDGFTPVRGTADSAEAVKYKTALKDSFTVMQIGKTVGQVEVKNPLNLSGLVDITFTAINPEITIPKLILGNIFIPERILIKLTEQFIEAMAYPELDMPMYKPLVDISSQLFLPNINFIEENSISLLETNQEFIESYMVGLNHEFSRELLWREYPTDQRGSYFRQFWDVSSFFDGDETDEEALKEKLRDIPPLHRWSKFSKLGEHDHREEGIENEEEVVLVIRGELLKKYPNAVIYAQKARWQLNKNGTLNNKVERELIEITPAESANPPKSKLKTPLYEAKVAPDIYFFGFDLTVLEAQGGTGESPDDINKPGWFFCIKERPGEPRFGLDIGQDTTPNVWNDLSWEDVIPGSTPGAHISITDSTATIGLSPLDPSDNEKQEQRADDNHVSWHKDMNAAELAYILYQVPVLIAVHAAEMLPKD